MTTTPKTTSDTGPGPASDPHDRIKISATSGLPLVDIHARTNRDYIERLSGDPEGTRTARVVVSRESLLRALTEVGLVPDTSDVVVREADLPAVTWDVEKRAWVTDNAMLPPEHYRTEHLDEREREALGALALVRHARTHVPPKPEPTNAERLAKLIRTTAGDFTPEGVAAGLDAAGVKAPTYT